MRTYDVSWTQGYRAKVEATNREDARLFALHMPDRDTLVCVRNVSIREVSK